MNITVTQIGSRTWRWKITDPVPGQTYYEYRDGLLVEVSTRTDRQIELGAGEIVRVEILDSPSADPEVVYSRKLELVWNTVDGAASYRIDHYVGAAWVQDILVPAGAVMQYSWITRALADGEIYHWRIVPVSASGQDGVALEGEVRIVGRPDILGAVTYDPEAGLSWAMP